MKEKIKQLENKIAELEYQNKRQFNSIVYLVNKLESRGEKVLFEPTKLDADSIKLLGFKDEGVFFSKDGFRIPFNFIVNGRKLETIEELQAYFKLNTGITCNFPPYGQK